MATNPLIGPLPSWGQVREAAIKALRAPDSRTPPPPPPQDVEGDPIPEPLDPLMEGRQAFNPYRGTEFHGVENPDGRQIPDAEGYGPGTVDVIYDEEPKAGTIIPVRVVTDAAVQIKAWRAFQTLAPAAGNPPAQIVGQDRSRQSVKVKNMSTTDDLWVGSDANLSAFNGYRVTPDDELSMGTTEAVYATGNGPGACPVCIVTEYSLEA
jgi:hypothetical protein